MLQPSDNAANLEIEEEKNSSEKLSNEEIAENQIEKKVSSFRAILSRE